MKKGSACSMFILLCMALSCSELKKRTTLNGAWTSIGSGWVLAIQDSSTYQLYDVTTQSCVVRRDAGFNELASSLELTNDTLTLKKGVISYLFKPAERIPENCTETLSKEEREDPMYNFEVFAQTVRDHYAFFELNNTDWPSLYEQQKQRLLLNPSDIELYKVIDEILLEINDNHAYLEAPEQVYAQLEDEESEEETEGILGKEYGDFEIANVVTNHHLIEDYTKDSWLMSWGKITDSIGYIQVKTMWLYADLGLPQSLIDSLGYVDAYVTTFSKMNEGDYIRKEAEAVATLMKKVMDDLKDTESIVIDVRFNGGGQDAVSFEILSHFITGTDQVATQKLRYNDTFTPELILSIEGKPDAYTKPVYVLTSSQTGSAAEAFSIATMALPDVQRIGSRTAGAMSTALEKQLPNGWFFSISNEVYMDMEGKVYENTGVPPDHRIAYSRDRQTFFRSVADDLESDKDRILDAIQKLGSN
ncbi:MAG: S41 family peptidase [Bacteroidota bacterium]